MSDYTTIKISRLTLRCLVRYKALLEREYGKTMTFDDTVKMGIIMADWYYSKILGLTDKGLVEHIKDFISSIKDEDEQKFIESLKEEMEAFGLIKK